MTKDRWFGGPSGRGHWVECGGGLLHNLVPRRHVTAERLERDALNERYWEERAGLLVSVERWRVGLPIES